MFPVYSVTHVPGLYQVGHYLSTATMLLQEPYHSLGPRLFSFVPFPTDFISELRVLPKLVPVQNLMQTVIVLFSENVSEGLIRLLSVQSFLK